MSHIVNGTVGFFVNTDTLKRWWESDRIQDEPIMEEICSDDGKPELIMEGILIRGRGGGVSEIDFIENVRSMAQIFYAREKKEKDLPIYDWKLFQIDMESKNSHFIPFFNM